ncbi:peptidoglycan-binding domain-containing protein [Streptomyces minutiscleroticus]|uniref:peptidoglycan-binding domain-containing protein n=1 Tax=Streptomyces minutiscleroticus TaxID=68238 RepID=UPI00331EF3AC
MPGTPAAAQAPGAAPAAGALTAPLAPAAAPPNASDVRLFEVAEPVTVPSFAPSAGDRGEHTGRRGRGRRFALAGAGAAVVVAAAAGFAGGLLSYEGPTRDSAYPDDIRASVPDAAATTSAAAPTAAESSAPPTSASASASASADPTPTETASAEASPTSSATPSRAASSAPADDRAEPSATPSTVVAVQVLRRGDQGPEVAELQQRLRQVWLYHGDANGRYSDRVADAVRDYQWSRGIRGDEAGVYGEETRRRLEAETREP